MDDMDTHRKKRLADLIQGAPYNGDRPAFIARSGLTKGRVAQLLDTNLPFGAISARRLETVLGLEEMWFDKGGLGESTPWPFVHVSPSQFFKLSPEVRRAAEAVLLSAIPPGETPAIGRSSSRKDRHGKS